MPTLSVIPEAIPHPVEDQSLPGRGDNNPLEGVVDGPETETEDDGA